MKMEILKTKKKTKKNIFNYNTGKLFIKTIIVKIVERLNVGDKAIENNNILASLNVPHNYFANPNKIIYIYIYFFFQICI